MVYLFWVGDNCVHTYVALLIFHFYKKGEMNETRSVGVIHFATYLKSVLL